VRRVADDPGPAHGPWRRVIVVAGVLVLAAIVSGTALHRRSDDHPTAGLTVGWGGSEDQPSCVYDPDLRTVGCKIAIEGTASPPKVVTVTITAYADENTSEPVGPSSRSVPVDGTEHLLVLVTVPVDKAPHVDEDGETSCRISVKY
jgi:hypothetical protein